jgi:hypothetical protein
MWRWPSSTAAAAAAAAAAAVQALERLSKSTRTVSSYDEPSATAAMRAESPLIATSGSSSRSYIVRVRDGGLWDSQQP